MDIRERDFKANNKHWDLVVEFFEEFPEMLKRTFSHQSEDNRNIRERWENLTARLNSIGCGRKSVEKWKQAIARWKCKVKSKAAAYKQEQLKTGGGPCLAQPLNDVEARLMNIYGWRSLSGDGNNELFFKKGKENMQVEVQPPAPLAPLPPLHIPAPGPAPASAAAPAPLPPVASTSRETQPKRKASSGLQSQRSKRFVSMNRMHTEHIEALKEINNNIVVMSSAMTEIKIDFKRLVDHIISKNL